MVVRHTGKVGRAFGIIYADETILRLRFNDGYEASFRLTDLQAASTEQIEQFEREEVQNRKLPSPPPPRLSARRVILSVALLVLASQLATLTQRA